MVCKNCKDAFEWLDSLGQHYQPIYGFEDEYVKKGKIKPERVEGFNNILRNILHHSQMKQGSKVLDIGSNLGWFVFELDELDMDVTGVEMYSKRVRVCEAVKEKMGLKDHPTFIDGDAVSYVLDNDTIYDYVLILNTLHHILRANEEGGWEMFNKLIDDGATIYAMIRSSLRGWSLKYPRDIPKSILEQSHATHYDTLDRIHGRTIYAFSKSPEVVSVSANEVLPTVSTKTEK